MTGFKQKEFQRVRDGIKAEMGKVETLKMS